MSSDSVATSVVLNNGTKMPLHGFGTWKLNGQECATAVQTAMENGYPLLDCAPVYGNEDKVGEGLAAAISSGKVKREDVFVVSKLWNTHHNKEHVEGALDQTLKDLRVDYLDLYLIHWPCSMAFTGYDLKKDSAIPRPGGEDSDIQFGTASLQETWEAMEALLATGKVRAIGVSNWSIIQLLDLFTYAKVKPAVNQIEVHPENTRWELVDFCQKRGIHVQAFSSLGSGKEGPLTNKHIVEIAKKHGKTPAQICLRWAIQRKVTVIPKSATLERVKENGDVWSFSLSEEDMKAISALNVGKVVCDMRDYWGFPITA